MLFWSFVILLVVGIVCWVIGCSSWKYNEVGFAGVTIVVISAIVLIVMLGLMVAESSNADSTVAANIERHKALTYKLESGACRDEFGLLSKSVIDEIQDWNEDVVSFKVKQRNLWIGIFIPNVYDQFETIDYTKYNAKE